MRPIVLITAWILSAVPAVAIDDQQSCRTEKADEVRIEACSRIVLKRPVDALAYFERGIAYQRRGDRDHALADFSKAIELRPTYAAAYESRGLVYAAKGDYVNALADVTRSKELTAKGTGANIARPRTEMPKKSKAVQQQKPRLLAKTAVPSAETANGSAPKWAPPLESP